MIIFCWINKWREWRDYQITLWDSPPFVLVSITFKMIQIRTILVSLSDHRLSILIFIFTKYELFSLQLVSFLQFTLSPLMKELPCYCWLTSLKFVFTYGSPIYPDKLSSLKGSYLRFRVRLGVAKWPKRLPRPSQQTSTFWLPWLSPVPCILFSAQ